MYVLPEVGVQCVVARLDFRRRLQAIQRAVPKNPKFDFVRPVVDTGASVSKVEQISTWSCCTSNFCNCRSRSRRRARRRVPRCCRSHEGVLEEKRRGVWACKAIAAVRDGD
jgi:hypothetical protein